MSNNSEEQDAELEALLCMYCGENEVIIHDRSATSKNIELKLNLDDIDADITLLITIPPKYPSAELPSVLIRSSRLKGGVNSRSLHTALLQHLQQTCQGQTCCFQIIDWVKEHAIEYFKMNEPEKAALQSPQELIFVREFFYFHHIYSEYKRKFMLNWADELNLSGILYPGKPGTVIIEGSEDAVREFGVRLRALQWQKMSSRQRDTIRVAIDDSTSSSSASLSSSPDSAIVATSCKASASSASRASDSITIYDLMNQQRKFEGFHEIRGDGGNFYHSDQSYLLRLLSERGLESAFTALTGFET